MCLLVIVSYFYKNGLQATNSNAKFYLYNLPSKIHSRFLFYDDKPANSRHICLRLYLR